MKDNNSPFDSEEDSFLDDYRTIDTEELEDKIDIVDEKTDFDFEKATMEMGDEGMSLGSESLRTYNIPEGRAADIAYLAWENEGPVSAADIQRMSLDDDYSAVSPMTTEDARNGLRALAMSGLVSMDLSDAINDFTELYTEEALESAETKDLSYNTDMTFKPVRYDTGEAEQLMNPEVGEDGVITDPARAFQEIGQMQEDSDFDGGYFTNFAASYF